MYNASSTIVRALDSIKDQTFKCYYQIIVVNDGSKDNSQEIVEKYIADHLIDSFDPHKTEGLFNQKSYESKYYKAILQNLFFAMLNSPITTEGSSELSERHFRNGRADYDNNKLMRYEEYFKNPQLFVDLANRTVPFLNGGLFDCLDDKDHSMYYDGFSDRDSIKKSLVVPDSVKLCTFASPDTGVSGVSFPIAGITAVSL